MADQLPSWADGQARAQILGFVWSVTEPGASFVPVPERVAAFERTRPQKRSPTPSPRAGSPPHPTCEIPAAAARTGELSGHVLPNPDPM
jgi:hypothetical protein